jgi:hypothetical protein
MPDEMEARILAAMAAMEGRLTDRIQTLARTVERLDTTVDQSTRALRNVQVRLTSLENTTAHGHVATAEHNARMDDLEARLVLIEKRLELRDQ